MRLIFAQLVMLFAQVILAQVNVDKQIILTSPINDERQIVNIGEPLDANDGVSVRAFRNGSVSYGTASGSNIIQVALTPNAQNYSNGMLISFSAVSNNTDTVYVNVDGLGYVMVHRPDGLPLDPSDIRTGQIVVLTYLNGYFVLFGRRSEVCPIGAVKANEIYCIQVNESAPQNYFDAVLDCHDQGGRLCKWDEHFYACQRLDLNLQDMFNNWEWIDDTSDHTHTADQVNRWSCMSQRSTGAVIQIVSEYRCCFTIR